MTRPSDKTTAVHAAVRTALRVSLTAALLLALLPVLSCANDKAASEVQRGALTALAEPENALSEELMLSLGQAKNFHHKADVLMSDGKLDEAAVEVAKILDIPFPAQAPESEDALLDTRARLAKLRVAQDQLDAAMTLVDEGIAAASRESFFLANLHTVRGEIFEAVAEAAEPGSEAAKDAKRAAIAAFDASIQINDKLIERIHSEPQP